MTTKDKTSSADLEELRDDLQVLKQDFAQIINHLQADGESRVQQLKQTAQEKFRDVRAGAAQQVENLGERVQERPVESLLVAFGVGLVTSFLLTRR